MSDPNHDPNHDPDADPPAEGYDDESDEAVEARLEDARKFIDTILGDPELLARFEAVGRGREYFLEGRRLYEEAARAHQAYKDAEARRTLNGLSDERGEA